MKIKNNNALKKRLFLRLANEYLASNLEWIDLLELLNENNENILKLELSEFNTLILSYVYNRTLGLKKC